MLCFELLQHWTKQVGVYVENIHLTLNLQVKKLAVFPAFVLHDMVQELTMMTCIVVTQNTTHSCWILEFT